MKLLRPFQTDDFYCEHLFESAENLQAIQQFDVTQQSGKGLENYLKYMASDEEESSSARTYVVKSKDTGEIAAYFTLKAGLFTVGDEAGDYFYTIPAAELANFAVNSTFRNTHPQIDKIGKKVFSDFILPLVDSVRELLGIQAIYIYALPYERLLEHYASLGFHRLAPEKEKFVHQHVKPKYDDGCIFMYQTL